MGESDEQGRRPSEEAVRKAAHDSVVKSEIKTGIDVDRASCCLFVFVCGGFAQCYRFYLHFMVQNLFV